MAADASAVESAFAQRLFFARGELSSIQARPNDDGRLNAGEPEEPGAAQAPSPVSNGESRPVLQKGIRLRDKEHRKFVASKPCLVCGRAPSDPHHLRFAQPRALGRRVSDEFTVPLCRIHHRELHREGDEAAWWRAVKIDPMPLALNLWRQTQTGGAFDVSV